MPQRFYVETLGCPKNQVDSDKLVGTLLADGHGGRPTTPAAADLVVVNTCAFIEDARQESIDTILALDEQRQAGARLVVTGCMAERYGDELADALPEVDPVAGFGVPVDARARPAGRRIGARRCPALDLLNLPRPPLDRAVGLRQDRRGLRPDLRVLRHPLVPGPAAQPRRRRRSSPRSTQLGRGEIVLVAQDLASLRQGPSGRARRRRHRAARARPCASGSPRTRLLYLYPSDLTDALIDAICATGVPYFDLSLQHVSQAAAAPHAALGRRRPLPAPHRRHPRAASPTPPSGRNFIVGYPGETEADHDQLLAFVEEAQLDWCGFFAYSRGGRHLRRRPRRQVVAGALMAERLAELRELQDAITAAPARRADRHDGRGARRRARRRPQPPRGARDRRHRPGATTPWPWASCTDVDVVDALGPRPRRRRLPVDGCRAVSHDPSAIATWANVVTVARVLVSPVLFVADHRQRRARGPRSPLWFVLCASDGIDGCLARRHGTTRSGAFLDPLADKVLVLGAMFTLVGQRRVLGACRSLIIAAREVIDQPLPHRSRAPRA